MSTLLSDLDGAPGPASSDGDLVNQILREMNTGAGAMGPPPPMPSAPPPPSPASMPPPSNPGLIVSPQSNTAVADHRMEMNPATAHMVGGMHPTPADFAASVHGVPYSQNAAPLSGGGSAAPPRAYEYPKRSLRQRLTEEIKTPILVALLVFSFSLPVVNFLFAHYLPSMTLPTGHLTTVGLLLKSFTAGFTFWLLQRVIVPLFSL